MAGRRVAGWRRFDGPATGWLVFACWVAAVSLTGGGTIAGPRSVVAGPAGGNIAGPGGGSTVAPPGGCVVAAPTGRGTSVGLAGGSTVAGPAGGGPVVAPTGGGPL